MDIGGHWDYQLSNGWQGSSDNLLDLAAMTMPEFTELGIERMTEESAESLEENDVDTSNTESFSIINSEKDKNPRRFIKKNQIQKKRSISKATKSNQSKMLLLSLGSLQNGDDEDSDTQNGVSVVEENQIVVGAGSVGGGTGLNRSGYSKRCRQKLNNKLQLLLSKLPQSDRPIRHKHDIIDYAVEVLDNLLSTNKDNNKSSCSSSTN